MRKIIFLLIITFVLIACSPTHDKGEINVNKSIISIDSIVVVFYKNGVRNNEGEYVFYSQLIEGNKGYFHILYENDDEVDDENLKRVGKSYRLLYQIFRDSTVPLLFDDDEGIISINFVEEFPVLVGNKKYLIEKYEEKEIVSTPYDIYYYRPLCVHYLSKEIGLIAIVNHRQLTLAEHNSKINDSVMKKISEKVIEEIEKTGIANTVKFCPGAKNASKKRQ